MLRRRFLWLGLSGVAALSAGGATWSSFSLDLARARSRLRGVSTVFETSFGQMEYAVTGEGPPCIAIHGTGGGFDQGLAIGRRLANAGRQIIAPSRFGYLRSANPPDPSPSNQADAFVALLDQLGIETASAIGVSAGALSALEFAIRHGDRCNGLVALVPASYVPDRPAPQPNPMGRAIMEFALASDFLFWVGARIAQDAMTRALLATDPSLVARAEPSERDRARTILNEILPVSDRAQGLLNDAAQSSNPQAMKIEQISAPTLAISLDDDGFKTADAARYIARTVPNAQLVVYPTGGHVWIGHDEDVFARIEAFLPRA